MLPPEAKFSGEVGVCTHSPHTYKIHFTPSSTGEELCVSTAGSHCCSSDDLTRHTERTRWTRSSSVTACDETWEPNAAQSPSGESHKSLDVTLVTSAARDGIMASPSRYGRSARDITNVMQKLQGRCENAYSHCSTWVCSSFRGDSVPCTAHQKSPGLRHFSSANS